MIPCTLKTLQALCACRLNYNEAGFMEAAMAHVLSDIRDFSPQSVVGSFPTLRNSKRDTYTKNFIDAELR